jgi:hypothetical protein
MTFRRTTPITANDLDSSDLPDAGASSKGGVTLSRFTREAIGRRLVVYNINTLRSTLLTPTDASASTLTNARSFKLLKEVVCNVANGSPTLTVTGNRKFDSADVGRGVGASGDIPSGTTILSVNAAGTTATMSANATGTTSNRNIAVDRVGDDMRVLGTVHAGRKGATYPDNQKLDAAIKATGIFIPDSFAIYASHYGQAFEIGAFVSSATPLSQVRVWVDEGYGWRAVTASPYLVPATSSKRYVLFDFGSVAQRQIRIECAQGVSARRDPHRRNRYVGAWHWADPGPGRVHRRLVLRGKFRSGADSTVANVLVQHVEAPGMGRPD